MGNGRGEEAGNRMYLAWARRMDSDEEKKRVKITHGPLRLALRAGCVDSEEERQRVMPLPWHRTGGVGSSDTGRSW